MNPRANSVIRLALSLGILLAGSQLFAQASQVFFSTPVNLSHNPDDTALSYSTHMALDAQGNINVIWAEDDCLQVMPFTCTWHLYFTRSTDGAVTFSTPKDVANQAPGDAVFGPQIAIDRAGRINIVWEGDITSSDIYYIRSSDNGATFSLPRNVSLENGDASNPRIALGPRGDVNLVWEAFNSATQSSAVYFSRSTDGMNFLAPANLCASGDSCDSPEIARDLHNHINLVWSASACFNCNEDVFYTLSADSGASFSAAINLSNNPNPMVSAPQIIADRRGGLNVVWSKGNPGSIEVFYTRSINGVTFSAPIVLSTGAGDSSFPMLGLGPARFQNASQRQMNTRMLKTFRAASQDALPSDCDAINAAWYNNVAAEIFFSRSTNLGVSFSTPKAVSTSVGSFGTEPYLAVDPEGRIDLVWQDGATDNIFFSHSNDGGTTFSKPRTVSTSPSFSVSPQLALDYIGNVNVSWFDNTTPIEDVFFARGTSLNLLRHEVRALPFADFRPHKRDAVLRALEKAKRHVASDRTLAIADLTDLLQHVNGCGSSPDSNDWIINCSAQRKVRSSLNIVINGLSQ